MPELFYIHHNTGYCGNCMFWWCVDGHGYTLDLSEAWKVTREQADEICRRRDTRKGKLAEDIAYPVAEIDAAAVRHVSIEALRARRRP